MMKTVCSLSQTVSAAYKRMRAEKQPRAVRKYNCMLVHTCLAVLRDVGAISPSEWRKASIEVERELVRYCPECALR